MEFDQTRRPLPIQEIGQSVVRTRFSNGDRVEGRTRMPAEDLDRRGISRRTRWYLCNERLRQCERFRRDRIHQSAESLPLLGRVYHLRRHLTFIFYGMREIQPAQ